MVQYLFANWVVHIAIFLFFKNQESIPEPILHLLRWLICKIPASLYPSQELRSSEAQKLRSSEAQAKQSKASKQGSSYNSLLERHTKGLKESSNSCHQKPPHLFLLVLDSLVQWTDTLCTPLQEWKKSPSSAISSRKLTMLLKKEGKEKQKKIDKRKNTKIE